MELHSVVSYSVVSLAGRSMCVTVTRMETSTPGSITPSTSPFDQAVEQLVAETGHTKYCVWQAVRSYDENWADSRVEDPTAEWCKNDPTVGQLIEGSHPLVGDMCRCADAPEQAEDAPEQAAAHIITSDAVALGDPEIIIMTRADETGAAEEIERIEWNRGPAGRTWDESLAAAGWREVGSRTLVGRGYYIVDVEKI